jgi:copper(I)-binding protein
MRYKFWLILISAFAAVGLAANAVGGSAAAMFQIKDAWIRWLPADLPAGGYLTLINAADQPVTLVGASSPDYGVVSLHRSLTTDGTSQMVPVDAIVVKGHTTLNFASQGYHLMLMQPKRSLKPGGHVAVTLRFAATPATTVQFEVRKPDATDAGAVGRDAVHGMPGMPGMRQ